MLMQKLLASAGEEAKLYSDDVFHAFTRTGTGADVTVTTGIDMTKGYMLWSKGRSGATDRAIYDSARGVTLDLASNTTAAQTTQATGIKSVSATGHTVGSLAKMNTSAATYVDFVFRKSPKFFDVVTYTGNGVAGRTIAHSLGQEVGMLIIKSTSQIGIWGVYHRSIPATDILQLQDAAARVATNSFFNDTAPTASVFSVGTSASANQNGATYVAYLFAHDTSADGIVQCGSFTTDASGNATVNLGWEPQYLMVKATTTVMDWYVVDVSRGWSNGLNDNLLMPNASGAEISVNIGYPTAIGFTFTGVGNNLPLVYLAIRRPNKPPTTGTQVYNAIARTGTGAAATVTGVGFAPDLVHGGYRMSGESKTFFDRLRGANKPLKLTTAAEISATNTLMTWGMDGVSVGVDNTYASLNQSTVTYINHFFKRAQDVFDVVCYTDTGTYGSYPHGLGVAPELVIQKLRSSTSGWAVFTPSAYGYLNTTAAFSAASSTLTSSVFWPILTSSAGQTWVTYLFATKAGISKVGSYTGNGTSQTVNCGFTTGSRFILIKRTDSTGDWFVYDTVRGIVAGNDPHLSLNTTAAEVTTDDSIDPDASGFVVNQLAATNLNVTSASYIFLSFA